MAVSFNVPASPQRDKQTIETFYGVDFTSAPDNVDITRSPDALNMVPSCPGKVRKSTGYAFDYEPEKKFSDYGDLKEFKEYNNGRGVYRFDKEVILRNANTETAIVGNSHPNSILTLWNESWGNDVVIGLSTASSWLLKKSDGTDLNGKVPMVTISRKPNGGGTPYEALNMLSDSFTDSFFGDGSSKVYQLSFGNVSSSSVSVKQLDSNGNWVNTSIGFSVNESTGAITFASAPPTSPITGEDNIRITAKMKSSTRRETIAKCKVSCVFNGDKQSRRLIVGCGSAANMGNRFWFSASNDLTFIPEVNYVTVGSESSDIVGLAM